MNIGPQAKSDNQFTSKCRLLQSKYRDNILKQDYGVGPYYNSQNSYGNMLINGEETGLNFITKAAFQFAKQKVSEKQVNRYLTIDEFRLFNNMLSSMPMCFNLFADLRQLLIADKLEASSVIRLLFKEIEWIETVNYIDVEFIPIPIGQFTNDKTAFDAMMVVTDKNGNRGLITIETKYTDLLGSNSSSNIALKNEIVEENKLFSKEYRLQLKQNGYKQIHRNYLLTYIYAKKSGIRNFVNVIISPNQDRQSAQEITEVKEHLTKNKNSIFKISLEDFTRRGMNCDNEQIANIMTKFQERYLNFE